MDSATILTASSAALIIFIISINGVFASFIQDSICTDSYGARRHIFCDDCIGAYSGALSHFDAAEDFGSGANINPIFDDRRGSGNISSTDGHLVTNNNTVPDLRISMNDDSHGMGKEGSDRKLYTDVASGNPKKERRRWDPVSREEYQQLRAGAVLYPSVFRMGKHFCCLTRNTYGAIRDITDSSPKANPHSAFRNPQFSPTTN